MSLGSKLRRVAALALLPLVAACVQPPTPKDYTPFRAEGPRSILVVPAINNSQTVEAADYFVSTIAPPFAERGYYVFPSFMVKRVMEENGLSDPGLVHNADARRISNLFGCDAVLFVIIENWESEYAVLATATKVGFTYELRSCKTNAVLWQDKRTVVYSPQPNSSGNIFADLIVMAIVAAVEKAAPNYIPLAKQANLLASTTAGQGLPAGPYLVDQYQKDGTTFPSTPTAAK
jgi:hypothetical protein